MSYAKKGRILLAALVVLALGGGGWLYLHRTQPGEADMLTLYGDIDIREVQPAFNDIGHITAILVQEGSVVKRGDLLATLDDARYAATLAQAKATAEAAHVTYLNDEVNYRRAAVLATKDAGTIQLRDDAKAAMDAAHDSYEAALDAVALAQRQFDDTRLYAPHDGVVEDRILEPGDMASPSTPVLTIALPNPLWVRAYVPENEFGRIRLGMAATVSTDSYPGHIYRGWIGYISPTAEFTPKTVETPELRTALVYQVRAYVCDARSELRLGMPATVHVDLSQLSATARPGCGPGDAARQ